MLEWEPAAAALAIPVAPCGALHWSLAWLTRLQDHVLTYGVFV